MMRFPTLLRVGLMMDMVVVERAWRKLARAMRRLSSSLSMVMRRRRKVKQEVQKLLGGEMGTRMVVWELMLVRELSRGAEKGKSKK